MVPGRARVAGAALIALVALAVAGCGTESHKNEPRPAVATRVSVTIGKGGITVKPKAIALEEEKHQQLPQNQNQPQPDIKTQAPLDVVFVTANQTEDEARLTIKGPKHATSSPISPNSPGTFAAELPTGKYTISVSGKGGGASSSFEVGPYRASSQNDLLLP
jgi:hypothetical protein